MRSSVRGKTFHLRIPMKLTEIPPQQLKPNMLKLKHEIIRMKLTSEIPPKQHKLNMIKLKLNFF